MYPTYRIGYAVIIWLFDFLTTTQMWFVSKPLAPCRPMLLAKRFLYNTLSAHHWCGSTTAGCAMVFKTRFQGPTASCEIWFSASCGEHVIFKDVFHLQKTNLIIISLFSTLYGADTLEQTIWIEQWTPSSNELYLKTISFTQTGLRTLFHWFL